MVSAHWENDPLTVSATRTVPLFSGFWGFPDRYYQVTYPAPGAPDLAAEVKNLLGSAGQEESPAPVTGFWFGLSRRSVQFS